MSADVTSDDADVALLQRGSLHDDLAPYARLYQAANALHAALSDHRDHVGRVGRANPGIIGAWDADTQLLTNEVDIFISAIREYVRERHPGAVRATLDAAGE